MTSHSTQPSALVLIGILGLAGSAHAQQSAAPGVTTQPAVPTTTPTTPAATSTSSAATTAPAAQNNNRPSDQAIKDARRAGYTMKTKSGNYFFCREDTDVGTRFPTEHCVDADALALTLERQQRDKDQIRSMSQGQSSK